ncbi:3-hydroxyacyl-CoA dehydrogenase / enoyl-CoA hydratase / 3-hydroxybutyryl-CoA epimerase [Tranquillimonas rosea]|uniref:enoyl-CoA hydratase n=1 Tax=Tranquillimonas rosea TaxID=641238 RepID=A0A1H9VE11_9RHOB|nr:3-hydroxyacyl-CoA dehydrogenase NAD-binding domain-containing protein [Tranquillimonas rosea]SES19915.1 3-hydroxyacyl-CoA dehydrogenase / enoyl-CoA hydratase / 3-hydroxybutyryl-CoA epimerase [Tranquillimonas rosea]
MTGPVLSYLGETRLELGPLDGVEPTGNWRVATDAAGITWLGLDKAGSGTNTISEDVLRELADHVERIETKRPRAVVIRSTKSSGFAAGADIGGFSDLEAGGAEELLRQGHDVLDRIERLPCPTVAVIHGQALGGGFELALACDRRILITGGAVGFPEVRLGLHPGLGGTFRLTGLIDPTEAMSLMLTGKTAHAGKARKLGIVDVVTEERHVAAAVETFAQGDAPDRATGWKARAMNLKQGRQLAARQMRSKTAKQAPQDHFPAPHALIDLWEEYGDDPNAMQKAEIASFARLLEGDTAQNLIRVFFLNQSLKAAGRGDSGISRVHVTGAGPMGRDIAAWAAIKGHHVTLGDVDASALGAAVKSSRRTCEGAHLSPAQTRDALDRLMPDPRGYGVPRADLVIEAGPEDPDLKAKIHADLVARMKPNAILASNTSSLGLASLADALPSPQRFAGLHFFNPVPKMQLVEVVSHDRTDADVTDRLAAFCGTLGKLPARVRDYPGFLVNRALTPYLMEAMMLVDEGVDKETVDGAAIRFGMPMGPVTLADQIGLDICLHVAESLRANLDKPMAEIPGWLREKVDKGETGRKAGKGFYDWSQGTPEPGDAPEGPADLTDRLILPILDACVECLRRDVATDEDQVDGAMIFATGFAPFRGGPMHYARTRGTGEVKARLEALAEAHGNRFAPDDGWSSID